MKKTILSFLLSLIALSIYSQDINGKWYGVLNVMGKEVPFAIDLGEEKKLFNPNKESMSYVIDSMLMKDLELTFFVSKLGLKYSGRIVNDSIIGFWNQSGTSFPLIFTRNKIEAKVPKRPQTPEPPFNYYSEELTVSNSKANITLSGTLTLPANDGKKYPIVVLISGSGPQDRDSEILGHKSFAVIADHFAKQGIGSFRYDDRGTAKSTGNYRVSDLNDFYSDLEAVVQVLKLRPEVAKLGLAGHSEGGILAPWYASEHKNEIDFVIMLAGPGIPISEMMHLQREFEYKKLNMTTDQIQQQKVLFQKIDSIVISYNGVKKTEVLTSFLTNYLTKEGLEGAALQDALKTYMSQMDRAWYKSFVAINPEDYLKNLKCPLLALGGLKDFQVPTEVNFDGILEYKKQRCFGKPSLTRISYSNLNHLFQPCATGGTEEYGAIETTFDRRVLFAMSDFINSL